MTVQNVNIPIPAHRYLTDFPPELTWPRHSLSASLHQGWASHIVFQVTRVHLLDLSLPTGICYSILTYAIHFRHLLQDGDITDPSLASSGAVLEITWSGENS